MSIEIKQMIIKISISCNNAEQSPRKTTLPYHEMHAVKNQIIAECREVFADFIKEQRDR